jgi:hypothetical protein
METLRQTIRDLNLGSLTEFKVAIVNARKDVSAIKSENVHLRFMFSQLFAQTKRAELKATLLEQQYQALQKKSEHDSLKCAMQLQEIQLLKASVSLQNKVINNIESHMINVVNIIKDQFPQVHTRLSATIDLSFPSFMAAQTMKLTVKMNNDIDAVN